MESGLTTAWALGIALFVTSLIAIPMIYMFRDEYLTAKARKKKKRKHAHN